ncbi:major facilitator superfamily domain-containing protein [Bombardia bombarda]|uniref:Major facilitator superfamily domain-containing protein n=1 Tax=Bombardia bombarda TaxID=252184 RepID=A0AA39X8B7_9PEZI|nr:major facilitator superfamily domain-containing protein [Bombardia bombarda]
MAEREKDPELGLSPSLEQPISASEKEQRQQEDMAGSTTATESEETIYEKDDGSYQTPSSGIITKKDNGAVPSFGRQRSNNGYGVDELSEDQVVEGGDAEISAAASVPPQRIDHDDESDPFLVSWEGGNSDPMNPRSWPTWRKWMIVTITCFGAFCVTNASAIYTATYAQMDAEFGTTRLVATVGLSTYVLGIALGPFWSPLAEFYGRRPIYLCSFAAFFVWMIPSAVAKNIQTMIVVRFFQGLAGSAFLSVSGGTVGDMFTRDTMAAPMAIFAVSPFVGPATGPLFGGLINYYTSWRWTYYVFLIWIFVLFWAIALFVPETYHPVLLKQKAQRLRKQTSDARYRAPMETMSKSVTATVAYSLLRPFQLLIREPMCLILDLYSAILLGVLYLFFGAFPLVFGNNYGFNLWQVGLTFLGIFVAAIVAALSTPIWHNVRNGLVEKRRLSEGEGAEARDEPEDQLPCVIVAAPLITGGLFMFGFTTYPWVHWMVPVIGSGFFGLGTLLAFTGIFTFLVDAYPRYAASALAGNAFVRCSFGAIFPLFGVQMYEKLGYQWASALLAFLTLAMLPFPYLFFIYGKQIRAKSRFASAS